MVEGLEIICLKIIFNVGGARSSYIEAVQKAKQGDFEGVRECMKAGQEIFLVGHETHSELIQKEAQGEQVGGSMILVHAEDQLMGAKGFKVIAEEITVSYERIAELEKKLEDRQFRHYILSIGTEQEQQREATQISRRV